ncbi:hypothetical protein [Streptosporangium sp. NPDC051022]|uniref:hypothetical protein n=1 Tax=Streptosporangium sp. NPDC051022 TaxID=3155752 RepID=UPI00343129EE
MSTEQVDIPRSVEVVEGPVEEIRAAATRLREVAADATPGPWQVGNGTVIGLGIEQTSRGSFSYTAQLAEVFDGTTRDEENYGGHDLGSPEGDAAWIALAHPGLAEPLAGWLEEVADDAEKHARGGCGNSADEIACGWPLAVARLINGSD